MCNVAIAQAVLDVLIEFVSQRKLFTAFDITKEARNKSIEQIAHKDVRTVVGTELLTGQMGDYDRVLVELDVKNNSQALVYYPLGADPYDYHLAVRPAVPDPVDDDELEDIVGTGSTNPNVFTVTARGRVEIPQKLLSKVDDTGGTIDVVLNGTLICRKSDSKGRIRVGGISTKKVRIVADAKAITIDTV